MRRYDWDALREVDFGELLREFSGANDRQCAGRANLDSCPLHPGSDHAGLLSRVNRLRCWAEQKDLTPIDYIVAVQGGTVEEARSS